jgi:hypothetical protein
MGVVAVGAEEITLVTVPLSTSTSMDAGPPVPVLLPVTLTAETIGLLEGDELPAGQVEPVPVLGIVAVQAPAMLLVVAQHDLGMKGQLPASRVGRDHLVAGRARIDPGGEGGRGNFEAFLRLGPGSRAFQLGQGRLCVLATGTAPGKGEDGGEEDRETKGSVNRFRGLPEIRHRLPPGLAGSP